MDNGKRASIGRLVYGYSACLRYGSPKSAACGSHYFGGVVYASKHVKGTERTSSCERTPSLVMGVFDRRCAAGKKSVAHACCLEAADQTCLILVYDDYGIT